MKIKITGYESLVKPFQSLSGSRSLWEVFNDCIYLFSLAFQNVTEHGEKHRANESEYKSTIGKYSKAEQETIFKIFAEITDRLEDNPFQDLLGELYMRLNMGSEALGQFFTPYHLAQLNAKAIDADLIKSEIAEKGYVLVNEPACGAGANVIAFMEHAYENNISFQRHVIAVCQDISSLTARMCHVALSLLGVQAVIKIGDTLANPFISYRAELEKGSTLLRTPFFVSNGGYRRI